MPFELSAREEQPPTLKEALRETERRMLIEALIMCEGDCHAACQRLGISYGSYVRYLRRHGLSRVMHLGWRLLKEHTTKAQAY